MGRGDAVAVLARTRLEWVLLDWATMSIGAVVVGLYPTSSAKECAYILEHSEAGLAFAEDEEQQAKLASVRDQLPALREIVRFDQLAAFEADGRTHRDEHPGAADAAAAEIAEGDLGTLIYTSGTTGPPKGCMLTHKNLVTAAVRVESRLQDDSDVVLLFLPLAHSFGRLAHQAAAFHGSTLAFCAEAVRVPDALAARASDDPAGGPARVREDPRERARRDRPRGRGEARDRTLGDRRGRPGQPPPARGQAGARRCCDCRSASPSGSSSPR